MKKMIIFSLCFVFLIVTNIVFAHERFYKKEDLLNKDKWDAVIVLKIAGRLNCEPISFIRNINPDNQFLDNNLSDDMKEFNRKIESEDFLVVKSIAGTKKNGDIIKLKYSGSDGCDDPLKLGTAYLVFFTKFGKDMVYEIEDVSEYEQIKDILRKKPLYKDFVAELINHPRYVSPPELVIPDAGIHSK